MAYVSRNRSPFDRLLKPEGDEMQTMRPAGGPPAGQASPASSAAPTPNNPQASSAGGFVSFGQRLQANQGAANQMAAKVAGTARQGANNVLSDISSAQRGFNQKLQAGSLTGPNGVAGTMPTVSQRGTSAATPSTLSAAQASTPGAPPAGVAAGSAPQPASIPGVAPAPPPAAPKGFDRLLSPGDTLAAQPVAPARTLYAGPSLKAAGTALTQTPLDRIQPTGNDWDRSKFTYGGPDDLSGEAGYQGLEQRALDADDRLGATRDNAGLEGLVSDAYKGSRTAGGNALDAALTGAAGGERFADLRRNFSGLSKRVAEANTAARGKADAAKASTAAAAGEYGKRAAGADAEREAVAAAKAKVAADRQAELVRQAELPQQQVTEAMNDRRGVTERTTTVGEERQAQFDGLWEEWLKAGSPPYDAWKAARKAGG
jgi:hypothetical protein